MKRLLTNSISSSAGFPVKAGTWDFLQDAHKEEAAAIIIGMIGDTYDPAAHYRLYGFVITDDGGDNYSFTAGATFYNGEVYVMEASTAPVFMDNGPFFHVVVSNYTTNADPVTFTDATTHNVHNIRTMQLINNNTAIPAPVDVFIGTVYNPVAGTLASLNNVDGNIEVDFDDNHIITAQTATSGNYSFIFNLTNIVANPNFRKVGAKTTITANFAGSGSHVDITLLPASGQICIVTGGSNTFTITRTYHKFTFEFVGNNGTNDMISVTVL